MTVSLHFGKPHSIILQTFSSDLMPYRVDIYIGSDNGTRRIHDNHLKKVRKWADATFPEGYTILRGEGCYHGIYEDSVLINVLSNYDVVLGDRLGRLKRELKQEAILVVKSAVDVEVV